MMKVNKFNPSLVSAKQSTETPATPKTTAAPLPAPPSSDFTAASGKPQVALTGGPSTPAGMTHDTSLGQQAMARVRLASSTGAVARATPVSQTLPKERPSTEQIMANVMAKAGNGVVTPQDALRIQAALDARTLPAGVSASTLEALGQRLKTAGAGNTAIDVHQWLGFQSQSARPEDVRQLASQLGDSVLNLAARVKLDAHMRQLRQQGRL
jgi:hypothetical protein